MSKRLKLVSVRLKSDRGVYKNATFATATDVAFLMAKEIAGFDNETIGVLNLNAKGNLLSMNVVTLNAFEKNMADICAASILSNAGSTILISKEEAMIRIRKVELTKRFQSNMEMLGIPVLDHIEGSEKKDHSSFISYIKRSYGDTDPSEMDKDTANRLKYCGQILGIEVKDSLIIGKDVRYSFAAAGEKGWDDAETYKIDPESRMLIKEEQPEFCNSGWSKEHNVTKELSKAIQKAYGIDL